jgi:hypothetical protein
VEDDMAERRRRYHRVNARLENLETLVGLLLARAGVPQDQIVKWRGAARSEGDTIHIYSAVNEIVRDLQGRPYDDMLLSAQDRRSKGNG